LIKAGAYLVPKTTCPGFELSKISVGSKYLITMDMLKLFANGLQIKKGVTIVTS
jgi:hypothetical protein